MCFITLHTCSWSRAIVVWYSFGYSKFFHALSRSFSWYYMKSYFESPLMILSHGTYNAKVKQIKIMFDQSTYEPSKRNGSPLLSLNAWRQALTWKTCKYINSFIINKRKKKHTIDRPKSICIVIVKDNKLNHTLLRALVCVIMLKSTIDFLNDECLLP